MANIISILLVPALLLVSAVPGSNRFPRQTAFDPTAVDEFINRQITVQHIPGLALAITRGDQVLYVQGYGNAGNGQPVTPQTQFLIASVSKSFTAMAIMQLVEAGKIDLDAPVQRYLPEFTLADPAAASQITVRHLLNHTSGLSEPSYSDLQHPQPGTIAERVTSLRIARPVARPGTEYHYFNPNYGILARVVEVVSGQPFSDYLNEHIFQPLGMEHTISAVTFQEGQEKADHLAAGHLLMFGMAIPFSEGNGYVGGSGGVITTAEDLAPFLIAQINGGSYHGQRLVQPESIRQMQTPPEGIQTNYAMGWTASTANGRRIIEHAGVFSIYSADVVLVPQEGIGVALLYNVSSLPTNAFGQPQIRDGLIALLSGEAPKTGWMTVRLWSIITALLTLVGGVLAVRSLLRLPEWRQKARTSPVWKLLPGILWTFVPMLMLVWGIPAMTARFGDRVFGFVNLYKSMLGIFAWLALTGVLGMINGIARIALLLGWNGELRQANRPVLSEQEHRTGA